MHKEQKEQIKKKFRALDHPLLPLILTKHYLITTRLFIVVIATIFLLGGGGYLLDQQLNTKPAFTIIGLVLALPLSMAMTIKITRDLIKKTLNGKHS